MAPLSLHQIDLNLLVVLDVLLDELHVTRAAKRLHRSQSATSHALSRLRAQLNDPILVRVNGQMRPSPWSERIAPELRRLLRSMESLLQPPAPWDPAHSTRAFTLIAPDFAAAVIPFVLERFNTEAPLATVELVPPFEGMLFDLAEGRHDLCFFEKLKHPDSICYHSLGVHEHTVFMRRDHPALDEWSIESWLAYPHIRIRMASGTSPVDHSLKRVGLRRHGGPVVSNFLLALPILRESDALITVPRGVLSGMMSSYDLVARPAPISIPALELGLYFSRVQAQSPASAWFRQIVMDGFETMMDVGVRSERSET